MQTLAALMLSLMLFTTALLLHAVVNNDLRPATQPDRARVDISRQLVLVRGR